MYHTCNASTENSYLNSARRVHNLKDRMPQTGKRTWPVRLQTHPLLSYRAEGPQKSNFSVVACNSCLTNRQDTRTTKAKYWPRAIECQGCVKVGSTVSKSCNTAFKVVYDTDKERRIQAVHLHTNCAYAGRVPAEGSRASLSMPRIRVFRHRKGSAAGHPWSPCPF